MIVFSFAISVY